MITLSPVATYAEDNLNEESEGLTSEELALQKDNEAAFNEFVDAIEAADNNIVVNEDGQFELCKQKSVKKEIGKQNYKDLVTCIESVNELEEKGKLEITKNGTIFDPADDSLYVQGHKGSDKKEWKIWGSRNCYCKKCSKAAAQRYEEYSFGYCSIGALAAFISAPVSCAATLVGCSAHITAKLIRAKRKPRGVVVKATWLGVNLVSKQ